MRILIVMMVRILILIADRNGLDPDDQYGCDHPDDVRFSVFAVGACAECVILEGEHKWILAAESHIGKNKILAFCKSLQRTCFFKFWHFWLGAFK